MKRLALVIVALVGPLLLGACQEKLEWTIDVEVGEGESSKEDPTRLRFEEIMPMPGHLSPHQQGGDCWGDYFFQFVTNNSMVRIYDLSTKTLVQTLRIPSSQKGFVPTCHSNTVCFGHEYYEAEDIFPLIYVSTGYATDGYSGVLVYRITLHDGLFFITLVQTIKFPEDNSSWTEFVIGDEFAYLCYTSERVIYKVPMPKLKDGDHIISRENAIATYQFTPQPDWMFSSRNQDRLFHQGKILVASGVPQRGEASVLMVLNLETLERERIYDFKKSGLKNEPESVFIWQGDVCVAFVDRIVKLIL